MRKPIHRFYLIFVMAAMFTVAAVSQLHAYTRGAVLSPTRVVMEGRERSSTVKLINPDDATNRYKISLINMRMDEYGRRIEVKTPTIDEKKIIEMIRFSPRRATLGPKEWQTIRLMARKPADLPPGEYRVHLKVAPIPPDQLPEAAAPSQKVGVSLNVVFAITIPVIIRHGEGGVSLRPEQPLLRKLKNGQVSLETPLVRKGTHSALFNILAFGIPSGGEREKIGELKGVSMYTPNAQIRINIPIEGDKAKGLGKSPITLEIQDLEKREQPISGSWDFILDGSFH